MNLQGFTIDTFSVNDLCPRCHLRFAAEMLDRQHNIASIQEMDLDDLGWQLPRIGMGGADHE